MREEEKKSEKEIHYVEELSENRTVEKRKV